MIQISPEDIYVSIVDLKKKQDAEAAVVRNAAKIKEAEKKKVSSYLFTICSPLQAAKERDEKKIARRVEAAVKRVKNTCIVCGAGGRVNSAG